MYAVQYVHSELPTYNFLSSMDIDKGIPTAITCSAPIGKKMFYAMVIKMLEGVVLIRVKRKDFWVANAPKKSKKLSHTV